MHMVFLSFFSKFQFSGQKQQSGLRAGKKIDCALESLIWWSLLAENSNSTSELGAL
jgi:hypothetical protein